jgi:hypothetical protein
MVLLLCLSYSVWCDTFSLQQGLPSQVESDEEDLAADRQMLALYDADPVKTEQEFGADAVFIQELREHVARKMAMKNKPRSKKEDVSEILVCANSAFHVVLLLCLSYSVWCDICSAAGFTFER